MRQTTNTTRSWWVATYPSGRRIMLHCRSASLARVQAVRMATGLGETTLPITINIYADPEPKHVPKLQTEAA